MLIVYDICSKYFSFPAMSVALQINASDNDRPHNLHVQTSIEVVSGRLPFDRRLSGTGVPMIHASPLISSKHTRSREFA